MSMAEVRYERQKYLHILSNSPSDIDVYTWEDAELA